MIIPTTPHPDVEALERLGDEIADLSAHGDRQSAEADRRVRRAWRLGERLRVLRRVALVARRPGP